jgi:hypothetical protein
MRCPGSLHSAGINRSITKSNSKDNPCKVAANILDLSYSILMAAHDEYEGANFWANVPSKVDNPYADFTYFRENKPIYYHGAASGCFVQPARLDKRF